MQPWPAGRFFFRRRKTCPFSGANAPKIDYKDVKLLGRFVSERGKIVPSRITAVSAKKQARVGGGGGGGGGPPPPAPHFPPPSPPRAIKKKKGSARAFLSLLPYILK